MQPSDARILAVAAALIALVDAFAAERRSDNVDELLAFPFGLERRAARGLMREGKLATTRLGRRIYARRSALLALVGTAPTMAPQSEPVLAVDPAQAAREAYARPLRVVRGSGRGSCPDRAAARAVAAVLGAKS